MDLRANSWRSTGIFASISHSEFEPTLAILQINVKAGVNLTVSGSRLRMTCQLNLEEDARIVLRDRPVVIVTVDAVNLMSLHRLLLSDKLCSSPAHQDCATSD